MSAEIIDNPDIIVLLYSENHYITIIRERMQMIGQLAEKEIQKYIRRNLRLGGIDQLK